MQVLLRRFTLPDIAPCVQIVSKTLGEKDGEKARTDFLEGFTPKTNEYVFLKRKVAYHRGRAIAIGGVYTLDSHPKGLVGICWFAVDPRYQRKGVGSKLMKWHIKEAEAACATRMFVWAVEDAIPFYSKFGFRKSKMKLRPIESKILLVKNLSN